MLATSKPNFQTTTKGMATTTRPKDQFQTVYFGDTSYESVEVYAENTFSSEEFLAQQKQEAEKLLVAYEDSIEEVKEEQKRLKKLRDELDRKTGTYQVSLKANWENIISSINGYIAYGMPLENEIPYTPEQFAELSEEEQIQIVIDASPLLAGYYDNIQRFTKEYNALIEDITKGEFHTYEELTEQQKALDNDLTALQSGRYAIHQRQKEFPYMELATTQDYLDYVEEQKKNPDRVDLKTLDRDNEKGIYEGQCNIVALGRMADAKEVPHYLVEEILDKIHYDALTEDQRMMYSYLYDKKEYGLLKDYLEAIEDSVNRSRGRMEAEEFLKSVTNEKGEIDLNAWNALLAGGKGFGDGLENFGEGLLNVFRTEGMISTNQYAQMYILEALDSSLGMKVAYDTGVAVGTVTPTILLSTTASLVVTPAGGKAVGAAINKIGSALVGISAAGNAKNQALVDGYGLVEASLYGTCTGLSKSTLGYFLGRIPGLSKEAGLSMKNIFLGGIEKSTYTFVDAGMRAAILQEPVDLSGLTEDARNAFMVGAFMTFITNGTGETIRCIIDNQEVNVNVKSFFTYLLNHKNAPYVQALKAAIPTVFTDLAVTPLAASTDVASVGSEPVDPPPRTTPQHRSFQEDLQNEPGYRWM